MKTYGLILCGGLSTRMGTDKAFITYNGKPQWLHLYEMLKPICDEVLISCNLTQLHHFKDTYKVVVDHPLFKDAGPMTGLLTAFRLHPEAAMLVVGCDYPKLEVSDMQFLLQHADEQSDVVCYRNPATGIDDPLIAWYHPRFHIAIQTAYAHEQTSLRELIKNAKTNRLVPDEWNRLFSVDTPEARSALRS